MLGLHIAVANPVFFGLFSLAGLVALLSQGLRWRHVLLVMAALMLMGVLAFFVGACGLVAVITNTAPASPLTLTDWLIGILLVLVLPLLLLISCAVLSARRLSCTLQGAFPENRREKQR